MGQPRSHGATRAHRKAVAEHQRAAASSPLNAGVTLPIWITEIGWDTAPQTPQAVSDGQRAVFMRGAGVRAIGEWGAYVPKVFGIGLAVSQGTQFTIAGSSATMACQNQRGPL